MKASDSKYNLAALIYSINNSSDQMNLFSVNGPLWTTKRSKTLFVCHLNVAANKYNCIINSRMNWQEVAFIRPSSSTR